MKWLEQLHNLIQLCQVPRCQFQIVMVAVMRNSVKSCLVEVSDHLQLTEHTIPCTVTPQKECMRLSVHMSAVNTSEDLSRTCVILFCVDCNI